VYVYALPRKSHARNSDIHFDDVRFGEETYIITYCRQLLIDTNTDFLFLRLYIINNLFSMEFNELGLPDDPLLDHSFNTNNHSFRAKRISIFIGCLSLTVLAILLIVGIRLMYTAMEQRKPLTSDRILILTESTISAVSSTTITTTIFATTNELELSSKRSFFI
jgi:Ca2+/Na+ antiporter